MVSYRIHVHYLLIIVYVLYSGFVYSVFVYVCMCARMYVYNNDKRFECNEAYMNHILSIQDNVYCFFFYLS